MTRIVVRSVPCRFVMSSDLHFWFVANSDHMLSVVCGNGTPKNQVNKDERSPLRLVEVFLEGDPEKSLLLSRALGLCDFPQ